MFRFKIVNVSRKIFDSLDSDYIIKLYAQGETLDSIAAKLSVNPMTIKKVLLSHGVHIRNKTEQVYFSVCLKNDVTAIVQAYRNGESLSKIRSRFGLSERTMFIILERNGIQPRGRSEQSRINGRKRRESRIDAKTVESLYLQGIGIAGIADRFNVAPNVIKRMIEDMGHIPRNRSEQQFARMQRTTKEERILLTENAHKAVRGRPASKESRIKIAETHQSKGYRRNSSLESVFLEMMTERGIDLTQQTAIETYNCDFTIDSIAVEIWGGNWHFTGEHAARFPERTNKIFDSGFDLIILPIYGRYKLTTEIADYLVSFIDELRRNPSSTRKYWVIWGAGEAVVSGGRESINNALVCPFVNRRNPSNGRYESILR